MSELNKLEFPVWDQPLPPPPRMTPEQYDRFLYETLFMSKRAVKSQYDPVPVEFTLVKEEPFSEGQTDE
jgi:hypothetical protein